MNSVAQHYSEQWDLLDSLDTLNMVAREAALRELLPQDKAFFAGKKVLVGGGAYGWEVLIFHQWGAEVTSVDLFTDAAIRFLRHNGVNPDESGIHILRQNLEELELPDKTFDFIYCNGILCCTPNPTRAFDHLRRVLKPGGHMVLGVYGSGGYLWALVHVGRLCARVLSLVGIGQKQLGRLLLLIPGFKGNC